MFFNNFKFHTCGKHNYTGTSECPDCSNEKNYNTDHLKFTDNEIHLMLDGLYHQRLAYLGEKKLKKEIKKIDKLIDRITKNFPD